MLYSIAIDMRRYYLLWASLSYLLLSLVAFIAGLVLQNLLFPSARTAAAGWLLYMIPFIALASLLVGVLLSYLRYRMRACCLCPWVIMVLSMSYGVIISWGYWMVWLSMLIATLLFYRWTGRLVRLKAG